MSVSFTDSEIDYVVEIESNGGRSHKRAATDEDRPSTKKRQKTVEPVKTTVSKDKEDSFEKARYDYFMANKTVRDCETSLQTAKSHRDTAERTLGAARLELVLSPALRTRCASICEAMDLAYKNKWEGGDTSGQLTKRDIPKWNEPRPPLCEFCTGLGVYLFHIWLEEDDHIPALNCTLASKAQRVDSSVKCFSTHTCMSCIGMFLAYLRVYMTIWLGWSSHLQLAIPTGLSTDPLMQPEDFLDDLIELAIHSPIIN